VSNTSSVQETKKYGMLGHDTAEVDNGLHSVYKKTEPFKFKLAITYCSNLTALIALELTVRWVRTQGLVLTGENSKKSKLENLVKLYFF
jgi:hypothetical protein